MCDRELREGASDKNEGEHTPADVATRVVARARGAAKPPPMGRS
jgi:hypothetical protein